MSDWHLYDDFDNGKQTGGGRIEYVRMFSIIAWIILFIGCINFMNLATARSEKRAREVGVRKVLGVGKKRLVIQFIGEAIFMTALAAIVSVVIMSLVLPAFNTLVQKSLSLRLNDPLHIGSILLITSYMRFTCWKLSFPVFIFFQAGFCFKRTEIKERRRFADTQRPGGITV
jgi:ABC-type antimicrobial peptide transport system permease subunit